MLAVQTERWLAVLHFLTRLVERRQGKCDFPTGCSAGWAEGTL